MTNADLAALVQLHESATPSPWFVRELNDEVCMTAIAVTTKPDPDDLDFIKADDWPATEVVAACLVQSPTCVTPADGCYQQNAALISAMRNALPELIRLAAVGLATEVSR